MCTEICLVRTGICLVRTGIASRLVKQPGHDVHHFYLSQRLKISGAIPSTHPLRLFMAWTGTALPLLFYPEYKDSIFLQRVSTLLLDHTASHPTRL